MITPCEIIPETLSMLFPCMSMNQYTRIQTPFLYPDGEVIAIFYKDNGDTATLTDLGETLDWLKMQTVTQRKSPRQRQLIADICLNHNIELYGGMLTTHVRRSEDLASAIMRLSQGILRVSDLWFAFRHKSRRSYCQQAKECEIYQ